VWQQGSNALGQSQSAVGLPQQHDASIGSDLSAAELGLDFAAFAARKCNCLWYKLSQKNLLFKFIQPSEIYTNKLDLAITVYDSDKGKYQIDKKWPLDNMGKSAKIG
jgi:hypothetical protein